MGVILAECEMKEIIIIITWHGGLERRGGLTGTYSSSQKLSILFKPPRLYDASRIMFFYEYVLKDG